MQSGHELIIVDPLNKSNNVARSTYQFVNIKVEIILLLLLDGFYDWVRSFSRRMRMWMPLQ